MTTLKHLPSSTARLLSCSQVITSAASVVKELIENSLDAKATSIEVKLENFGFDRIEVRDNGLGIHKDDIPFMAQRHYTSKITDTGDLSTLQTYGFRGEALGSLSAVSDVTITTKTKEDQVGMTHAIDHIGMITSSKPSHLGDGTTIVACNLFKNIPVRKQFYNTAKKKRDELARVEHIVMAFGVIRPDVRVTLRHNKNVIWQKNIVPDHRTVLMSVLGTAVVNNMEYVEETFQDGQILLKVFLPSPSSDPTIMSRGGSDRCFVFVNKRPVVLKQMEKLLKQYYTKSIQSDSSRYPLSFISLEVPASNLDVNVDPNKTQVMLHDKNGVLECLTTVLKQVYGEVSNEKGAKAFNNNNEISNEEPEHYVCSENQHGGTTNITSCDPPLPRPFCETVDADKNGLDTESFSVELVDSQIPLNQTSALVGNNTLSCVGKQMNIVQEVSLSDDSMDSFPTRLCDQDEEQQSSTRQELSKKNNLCTEMSIGDDSLDDILGLEVSTPNASMSHDHKSQASNTESDVDRRDLVVDRNNDSCRDMAQNENELSTFNHIVQENSNVNQTLHQLESSVDTWMDESVNEHAVAARDLSGAPFVHESSITKDTSSASENSSGQSSKSAAESWSKGQLVDKDGKKIQPVVLLPPMQGQQPGRLSLTPKHTATPGRNKTLTPNAGQPKLFDFMKRTPIKKPSPAYVFFAKGARPQVTAENPHASYQDIEKIIGEKWHALMEKDREKYHVMHREDVKRYKDDIAKTQAREDPETPGTSGPLKKRKVSSNGSVISLPPTPETGIEFSMKDMQARFADGINMSQSQVSSGQLQMIGPLKSHGVWVCYYGNQLMLFHTARAQEVITYNRLSQKHRLQSKLLDNPIGLNESNLKNADLLDILLSLEQRTKPPDKTFYFSDPQLLNNGIDIREQPASETSPGGVFLHGIPECTPYFSVHDVASFLKSVKNAGTEVMCRPSVIQNYLKSEAVRMTRQLPIFTSNDKVSEVLHEIVEIKLENKDCSSERLLNMVCLHDRPVFSVMFDMATIGSSQSYVDSSAL